MVIKLKRDYKVLLAHRRLPFLLPFLAMLLLLGTVGTGLQMDDYIHKATIQNPDIHNAVTDLFTFVKNPQQVESYLHRGLAPWWISENLRLNFFRPLAAATHWLDYRLWPNYPALMHIHNLLWFMAMVFCAALVYRKLMTPVWIAGLAALLFALDDAHGMPAGWIANRNALIAAVFGFLSLYFHLRWRLEKWRAGALLGPTFFLLSLLSAEAGVATGAYLLAFEIVLASDKPRRRTTAMLPYVVMGLAWQITYKAMGYGASGSGGYIDPAQNPLGFLAGLFERIPLLLYGQWLFPDPRIYQALPKTLTLSVLIFVYILLAVTLYVLRPLLKRDPVSRFWALGMLLALLPVCAALPDGRNLIFAGLGGMGILAALLGGWIEKAQWLPTSKIWNSTTRTVASSLIIVNLVIAPIMLPITGQFVRKMHDRSIETPAVHLAEDFNLQNKTVVLLNAFTPFSALLFPKICQRYDLTSPLQVSVLATGLINQINIRRVDDHSLEVEPENGFLAAAPDLLFRDLSNPMKVGQTVDMGKIHVQVRSLTKDGRPLKVRFSFAKALDDASLLFCVWQAGRYVPFTLPQNGQTSVVKSTLADFLFAH